MASKKKIKGYTKVKGGYSFVFQKGKKLIVDKKKYTSKSSLVASAKKYLKKK